MGMLCDRRWCWNWSRLGTMNVSWMFLTKQITGRIYLSYWKERREFLGKTVHGNSSYHQWNKRQNAIGNSGDYDIVITEIMEQ
jgi:hypothetical protein